MSASHWLVGIDLGTTHTVVAYAEAGRAQGQQPEVLPIDQLVAPGEVAALPLLASMRYHPGPGEIPEGDRVLPWQPRLGEDPVPDAITGALARELGSRVPGRLVASAKSWLSHPGVDRTAPILPWGAPADVARISPLEASAGYLRHVRHAWDARFPATPLAVQDIVLTVPASFDEAARRLSVEAARLAGLPRVRLIEEPQAACYDWLSRHASALDAALDGVRTLLVCEVGGGTTDLTLIPADRNGAGPALVRIGVGDHLMLGGDNMDLALAQVAERRLLAGGTPLGAAQLAQLVQQCRTAKERLLRPDAPETAAVTLLGSGSRLIGRARSVDLARDEVAELVVDGFFPESDPNERPRRRRAGIVELGLPYAADPAVTRHLAAFLAQHAQAVAAAGTLAGPEGLPVPDAVLLNGGVFRSAALAERLTRVLGAWRGEVPRLLSNPEPDLAVARGAVAYALARRGRGARIGGGSARGYFLRVEQAAGEGEKAVSLLPQGTEEGREIRLADRVFSLRLGQPVRFDLLAASGGHACEPGALIAVDRERFRALPPLATVLDAGRGGVGAREVQVELAATLTDVGTLEIECVAPAEGDRRWRLELQLRGQGAAASGLAPPELPGSFPQAAERMERAFGARSAGSGPQETKALVRDLEKLLGRRGEWETHLLRELFGVLWDGARRRRRTADHERLWFNLAGFCLRPGYGYPLDDWRAHQLWSLYGQGVQYQGEARNQAEWWTLWRRVAGGLDRARQLQLLDDIEGRIAAGVRGGGKGGKGGPQDDLVRLAAGLERLPAARKAALGALLLQGARRPADVPQTWWALGRLGARVPFYGSAHDTVPVDLARDWLERVLALDWKAVEPAAFAAAQLARLCGDRERDLDPDTRTRVAERLRREKAPPKWIALVETVAELDSADESRVFGESLPPGLRLVR